MNIQSGEKTRVSTSNSTDKLVILPARTAPGFPKLKK
jgi:hypothetical protein